MWIIVLAAVLWLVVSIFLCCSLSVQLDDIFSPKYWKRVTYCNWFGVTMITLTVNVLLLPLAICYWFYVLCHI